MCKLSKMLFTECFYAVAILYLYKNGIDNNDTAF